MLPFFSVCHRSSFVADAPPNVHLSLETFNYDFPQISVITRFKPARGRSRPNHAIKMPLIVIAPHLNSARYESPLFAAPGADDGGSGTVTILEAFRALIQAGFRPEVPVEFHWYAAEEGGLLGSQDSRIRGLSRPTRTLQDTCIEGQGH